MHIVFEHWVQLCVNIRHCLETVEIVSSSQKVMNFHERFGGISGGGGTPIWKGPGRSTEILKRNPMRYQDPVLWAWLEMFSPLRCTTSKGTYQLTLTFFHSVLWKVTRKLLLVDLLKRHQPRPQGSLLSYAGNRDPWPGPMTFGFWMAL